MPGTSRHLKSPFLFAFDESADVSRASIGGKGHNLCLMTRAGLPVPPFYCVPVKAYNHFVKTQTLPVSLVKAVLRAKQQLGGKIAIRSSANLEDGAELTLAGVFESHYVYEDSAVVDAIYSIFQQVSSTTVADVLANMGIPAGEVQMGLVIQQLIEPDLAGVIYTHINGRKCLVEYVEGFGDKLVDGAARGSSLIFDENGTITESSGYDVLPFPALLLDQACQLTKQVQQVFPDAPQDIEFAATSSTVYLVQSRPLASSTPEVSLDVTAEDCLAETKLLLHQLAAAEKREMGTATAIYSDSNYSELLPRPTEMDIGVYTYCFTGINQIAGATQRARHEMGYLNGDEAIGIIRYIGGKTYFSIARNAALYYIGFPGTSTEYFKTLVNEYLQKIISDPQLGAYPQMGLYLQDPSMAELVARFGSKAPAYMSTYRAFTANLALLADTFLDHYQSTILAQSEDFIASIQQIDLTQLSAEQLVDHCNIILEHLRTVSCVAFVKAARLGFYYSQRLRNALEALPGGSPDQAQRLYSKLNQGLDGSAITAANIAIAEAPSQDAAISCARELIGHFSTGEMLELRHPPLRDTPQALAAYVDGIRARGNYRKQFDAQKQDREQAQARLLSDVARPERTELEQIIKASQTYMALRETIKYQFSKENLLLRDALETLSARAGLPPGDIYYLYPRELSLLLESPLPTAHLIRSRQQRFELYVDLDLPAIITEDAIDRLSLKSDDQPVFTVATGKFLAEGAAVAGVIVNIDEFTSPTQLLAAIENLHTQAVKIILAGRQMNLSHDPLISQSDGLIIQNAGLVAHGAQRAREQGKGAIGGIRTDGLTTGMLVTFDPATHTVTRRD